MRARRAASKVVVVDGFGLHSPCTLDRRFYSRRIIRYRRSARLLIMFSEGADCSASRERVSGRSDDGLHEGRCERVEQIMVSVCLSGRAMHRRHDAHCMAKASMKG